MEGPEIHASEAVIDNGSFGTRTIRFETGLDAGSASGTVASAGSGLGGDWPIIDAFTTPQV